MRGNRKSLLWVAVLLGALMAGCASVGPGGATPEEQVRARAQDRWDLLLAGKLEDAYGYLSPAQRSVISLAAYQRQLLASKIRWRGAQAEDVECEEVVCTARVRVTIQLMAAVPGVSSYRIDQDVEEKWIQAQNQWWFVPE